MTSADTQTPISETGGAGLLPFIEWLIARIEPARFEQAYRITPGGLFVTRSESRTLAALYREWYRSRAEGRERSEEKCFRRIFGSSEPELVSLFERDRTLSGHMVVCEIKEPQRYRVPYYLGTPGKSGTRLDARDPAIAELPGVSIGSRSGQPELSLKIGQGVFSILEADVRHLQKLMNESRQIQQRFPKAPEDIAECVRALKVMLQRGEVLKPGSELLCPLRYAERRKDVVCRSTWGFSFFVERGGRLGCVYHSAERSFGAFLRSEIVALSKSKNRTGKLPLAIRGYPVIAKLHVAGRSLSVEARAFSAFVHESYRHPVLERRRYSSRSTAVLLEAFGDVLVRAEPIDRKKISTYLGASYQKGFDFLVGEVWLFVVSPKGSVQHCLARVAQNRQAEQRSRPSGQRSRSAQARPRRGGRSKD